MNISRKCRYALRAIFELASQRLAAPITAAQIAEAQGIPTRFLENIMNELRHAGLVISHRGNTGGYTLAVSPEELAVGRVIEATQGPVLTAAQPSQAGGPGDQFSGDAAFERFWEMLDDSVAKVCHETSVADLVRWETQSRLHYVPDYVI
jgi:Rrf2 family transcriptional regulator, cysteine metabolism repressor